MAQTVNQQSIDWQAVGEETIRRLQDLLRLDTRNPPGNEVRAAEYLRAVFEAEGIPGEIVGPSGDRGTFIARLKGDGPASPLLLMGHTDVVAVEPEKWTHDPFSGDIADGFIYGRGALDMKQMVTMEAMTMLLLKRAGVKLKRDVIYMAAADEECGGHAGAGWVVEHRPDLIQAEYALNEGGGSGLEINGRRYYPVQTAEKGTVRFRIRTQGKPGHGSVPHPDNAILKLAAILAKLTPGLLPVHFTQTARAYFAGLAATQPPDVAQALHQVLADEATADAADGHAVLLDQRGVRQVDVGIFLFGVHAHAQEIFEGSVERAGQDSGEHIAFAQRFEEALHELGGLAQLDLADDREVAVAAAQAEVPLRDDQRSEIERMAADSEQRHLAVGAAHLAGPDSVIKMLEKSGWKVERE